MLNIELLEKARDWILENPEHLNMSAGIERDRFCGTVACIAGTVCMLSAPVPIEDILESNRPFELWSQKILPPDKENGVYRWTMVENEAIKLLGITEDGTATALFYVDKWLDDYSHRYDQAKTFQEKARAVADYIDYFIACFKEGIIAI